MSALNLSTGQQANLGVTATLRSPMAVWPCRPAAGIFAEAFVRDRLIVHP
jgi:hypothetical protein